MALQRQLAIALICLFLTACGGGGSGDEEPATNDNAQDTSPTSNTISSGRSSPETDSDSEEMVTVQGMGVKGPLANAIVSVYAIDSSQENFKGRLLAEGFTDEDAKLVLDVPARHAIEELLLIEYTTGRELNGSTPVLPTLRTAITSRQFLEGTPVYATPLTTLVVDSAMKAAGTGASASELTSAMTSSGEKAKTAFGLGLLSDVDLFTHAPVLSNHTPQQTSLAYRTTIEVFAAMMDLIRAEAIAHGGDLGTDELIPAVAEDMQDGDLDGKNAGEPVAGLAALSETQLRSILTTDPSTLTIPGTETPVTGLPNVLADETALIDPNIEPTALDAPTLTTIEPDFTTGAEPAPTPAPEPEPTPDPEPTPEPDSEPAPAPSPAPEPSLVAPTVSFITPAADTTLQAGDDLPVEVSASDSDGSIAHCVLSINGTILRQENISPYQWGSEGHSEDAPLLAMASGDYIVKATCTDNDGLAASREIAITVADEPALALTLASEPEPSPDSYTLSLTWSAPTKREDGSDLLFSEIDHYEVYYYLQGTPTGEGEIASFGPAAGSPSNPAEITLTESGSYVFAIACVDTDGNTSDISSEVLIEIP